MEPAGVERGVAAIAQRPADRRTVPADDLGFRIGPVLDGALDDPHPAHPLAQCGLRMPIRFPNRPARFAQVVKLTQLMRHPRPDVADRLPDRQLPIADDAHHRQALQARHRALQQGPQVIPARGQQAARLQHLTGEHLPHDPEHFMTLVRL